MLLCDTFHTTYCTNIHPGPDWAATLEGLQTHLPRIRERVGGQGPFGIGLRLSNRASLELSAGPSLGSFRNWLRDNGFYVFTMNGFPYGAFHGTPVKDQVHAPDWTHEERLGYTTRLFDQLAFLLPEGMEGGISTSPVSYRPWHRTESAREEALRTGARQMALMAARLAELEQERGAYLHLDIEPEPDGMLENTRDVLEFYSRYLIPEGGTILGRIRGMTPAAAEQCLRRHINLCYDICHFALVYEDAGEVFDTMEREGIRIGKIQVSAALRADLGEGDLDQVVEALRPFNEPVYLHQVRLKGEGGIRSYPDLGAYLEHPESFGELRSHFHVPLFMERYGVLKSTQGEVLRVIELLRKKPVCRHLEVETYTWEVLPPAMKQDLDHSISRELLWLKERLEA